MKNPLSKIAILSVLLAAYPSSVTKAQIDTTPSVLVQFCNYSKLTEQYVEKKYVETDIAVIKTKVNRLANTGGTISSIKEILPKFIEGTNCNCNSYTSDLGYSLKMTEHTFYGGSGTYTASTLYFDDYVIQIRLTISFPYRNSLSESIVNAIKAPFDCVNDVVSYEKIYKENLLLYNRTIGTLFLTVSDSNERRKEAINYFTNVLTGWPHPKYYNSGSSFLSGAFDNLRYFITNNDFDALEKILFCPDINGRVLAARTLVYLTDLKKYSPSPAIKFRIDEIISKAKVITIYPSLSYIGETGKREEYDLVKNFEMYLKDK